MTASAQRDLSKRAVAWWGGSVGEAPKSESLTQFDRSYLLTLITDTVDACAPPLS